MRRLERNLVEHQASAGWMIEFPRTAFPFADVLRRPKTRERIAGGTERIDQRSRGSIVQMADRIRPELRYQPSRARLPIDNQALRPRRCKREAKQITVLNAVQPADEQFRRARVPAQRVPLPVEEIGRASC